MQKVGICLLALTPPRPWRSQCGKLCTQENAVLSVTCWCHHHTHSVQSPIGFWFCNFTFFFFLNLSTSFSSLYVPHPGSLTFPGCYIIFSHTNKVALTAPVCWSDLPSLRVNKDEHPSQFWRQNGNPHLLYFFCRETLVRAGHTCRRSHINLYERVVS